MLRATKVVKGFHHSGKRAASTQSLQKIRESDTQVTKLDQSGLKIVSANPNDKSSRVTLLVNAGSRYETTANQGISHALRAFAGLTNSENSAFMSTQIISQLGATFSTSGTKEHILYNLKCGRGATERLINDVVNPLLFGNEYAWYEPNELDIYKAMRYQKALANNNTGFKLVDAAHSASFRGGLANSIFSPNDMMEEHSTEMLLDYVQSGFTLDKMVLSATGVDHDALCEIGAKFSAPASGSSLSDKSSFVSSEHREQVYGSNKVHAALSFPGVSLNDQDTIALAVLQHAIGTQGHIKRGNASSQSALTSAVTKSATGPFHVTAFNANYSDNGLFGIAISSEVEDGATLLQAVNKECKEIANGKYDDKIIKASKERLKAQICMNSESAESLVEDMAVQNAVIGAYVSPDELCGKIDKITTAQVSRTAKKVLGGKKSLTAIGELMDYPYLQDL